MESTLLNSMAHSLARIKDCIIEQDGDMWICKHKSFINLQESNRYAFGYSPMDSFSKYIKLNNYVKKITEE